MIDLFGNFNLFSSYSMVETNYNMIIGMVGLLVMLLLAAALLCG